MKGIAGLIRRGRRSRWVIGTGIALAVYTLAGFLLLPVIIRWQMLKRLPALTKRVAAVQQVRVNPYALSLTIRGFSLTETNGEPFASFRELYVNLQLSSIVRRGFVFREITLKQPSANLVRRADGTFNFSNLSSGPPAETAPAPAPAVAKPLPLIVIDQLVIEQGAARFADRSGKHPFEKQFGPIDIRLSHFTTRPAPGSPYTIAVSTADGETLSWAGDISVSPPRSAGTFQLTGLRLPKYSPLVQNFARVDVRDGRLDLRTDYRLDASGPALDLHVSHANLDLRDLQIAALDTGETVVSLAGFSIRQAEADLARQVARVASITSTGGFARVRLNPDGAIDLLALLETEPRNAPTQSQPPPPLPTAPPSPATVRPPTWKFSLDELQLENYGFEAEDRRGAKPIRLTVERFGLAVNGTDLDLSSNRVQVAAVNVQGFTARATVLPPRESAAAAGKTPAPAAPPPETAAPIASRSQPFLVAVDRIAVKDGSLQFADESIAPRVSSSIDRFGGSIQGLSTAPDSVVAIDLAGQVNGYAPLTITGKVSPFAPDLLVDLAIVLQQSALTPESPYVGKYAGYALDGGALTLDLRYHVAQRALQAQNKVRVDKLKLGEPSHSPDAVKLPVKLAIALLQDRNGIISLDVPVHGRLDDPKFHLGHVIGQVFMNILTKAATAPFALLGSMFGSGQDLSFVKFECGRADFNPGETPKLDTLATALADRPALSLVLTGSADPVQDRDALARIKLKRQLAAPHAPTVAEADAAVARLGPEDYARRLKLAYAEALRNPALQSNAPTKPRPYVVSNIHKSFLLRPPGATNQVPETAVAPTVAAGYTPPEKTAAAVTVPEMETTLIKEIAVTADEYQALRQDRATRVQAYLLQTGKIGPDRLTIAGPKLPETAGQCRVNLTLQ